MLQAQRRRNGSQSASSRAMVKSPIRAECRRGGQLGRSTGFDITLRPGPKIFSTCRQTAFEPFPARPFATAGDCRPDRCRPG